MPNLKLDLQQYKQPKQRKKVVLKPCVKPQLPPPRTRTDVEFENQYTRLTIQNEKLRNQLKVLSMQMDSVIKDR